MRVLVKNKIYEKESFDECFTENAGLDLCSVLGNAGGQKDK